MTPRQALSWWPTLEGVVRTAAFLVCIALAGLAGCAAPAPPQPTGQVDGAVLDPWLNPFGGAVVELLELGLTDTTSDLGGFTFRSLPPGEYTLRAMPPGTDGAIATVKVRANEVTRVILQAPHTPEPEPTILGADRTATFASPHSGDRHNLAPILLSGRPDDIDVRATWTGTVSPPPMQVQLWGASGELLAVAHGSGSVHFQPAMDLLANGTRAIVPVIVFEEDANNPVPVPQTEVTVRLHVDLYYGTTYGRLMGFE